MTQAARVTITGAAGQIGYQLAFRIASGQLLGTSQPVILQLLEITPALNALRGVVMELEDCAFPALQGVVATDKAEEAFRQSLLASQGSLAIFWSNGLVSTIMALGLIALFWPLISEAWNRVRSLATAA